MKEYILDATDRDNYGLIDALGFLLNVFDISDLDDCECSSSYISEEVSTLKNHLEFFVNKKIREICPENGVLIFDFGKSKSYIYIPKGYFSLDGWDDSLRIRDTKEDALNDRELYFKGR